MPQTFTKLLYHVVFGTKGRRPYLDEEIRQDLHAYVGGIVRELGGYPFKINGANDHVHLLIELPPSIALSDAIRIVKTNSSKWVHERWPSHAEFAWQSGYGAFTVSQSIFDDVHRYITNQESHHKKLSFTDEFSALLKRHNIEYDPANVLE